MSQPPHHHPDFANAPWVAPILADPNNHIITTWQRISKPGTDEDSLFSRTFNTPETFRTYLMVDTPSGDTLVVVSLGTGVNGHDGIVHGGVVVTILDEALSAAVRIPMFTAYLNVAFKKPVPAPSVIVCRVRVTKKEGRKHWIAGTLEDGSGGVMAEAEALYIAFDPLHAKL